ncbi:MAG: hypothetical protein J6R86_02515, partial [Lentisphaeria bacterium]|nr:hypothetical protein [Lentisphaeria bacterium]
MTVQYFTQLYQVEYEKGGLDSVEYSMYGLRHSEGGGFLFVQQDICCCRDVSGQRGGYGSLLFQNTP